MKSHSSPQTRFLRLRSLFGRFAFVVLLLGAFGLMLLGKGNVIGIEKLRVAISDLLLPVMDVLSRPAAFVSDVVEGVRELVSVRKENTRLREENAGLHYWQAVASILEEENNSLRDILRYSPPIDARYVTGRVVADMGGGYVQSLLVTAGTRESVQRGQAVFSGDGLVGRISEAGHRSSRVLLLTDINSRIPVLVGNMRQKAILVGDNSARPKLLFLTSSAPVAPGDRVVTSGDADAFVPGIPVGMVMGGEDSEIRVEPLFRKERLDYVRIVDFGLKGILEDVLVNRCSSDDKIR